MTESISLGEEKKLGVVGSVIFSRRKNLWLDFILSGKETGFYMHVYFSAFKFFALEVLSLLFVFLMCIFLCVYVHAQTHQFLFVAAKLGEIRPVKKGTKSSSSLRFGLFSDGKFLSRG